MMPTPYSGSHRISDPKPGRPPLCATMWPKAQVWRDAEAVAVAAGVELHRAGVRSRDAVAGRDAPDLLHLAQRRAADRAGLRAVARRPRRRGTRRRTAPRSRDRRQHAAHRAEGAVGQRRLLLPLLVFPPIAVREAVRRHRGRLERRRRHAERLAGSRRRRTRGTASPRRCARCGRGSRSRSSSTRRRRRARSRTECPPQHLARTASSVARELLVAPRVVLGKAFGVRQQVADGDARRVGRRIRRAPSAPARSAPPDRRATACPRRAA